MNKSTRNDTYGLVPDYANVYNSGMEISRIIQGLLQARGWTQDVLAERLDTSQNNISRWVAGVEPRGTVRDRILEMARESGVIDDGKEPQPTVPLMGRIGAGGDIDPDFEQVPIDGFGQVELPMRWTDDVIAFEVIGDSMRPQYRDGDVVVVHREQVQSTTSLIGELAAVRTYDGKRYLKVLMPGPKPHTYNLESFNAQTIIGARIQWASAIVAMIPSKQVRHRKSKRTSTKPVKSSSKRGTER